MNNKLLISGISILLGTLFACQSPVNTDQIDSIIDAWHKAAADADAEAYFGLMTEESVFIGTDASERWVKKDFMEFAMPYFNQGKAWDFTAYNRHVISSRSGTTVYFDELLHTWMGICRGSGVLEHINGDWKLMHYTLSVTVPNELINNFIDLINSGAESASHLQDEENK